MCNYFFVIVINGIDFFSTIENIILWLTYKNIFVYCIFPHKNIIASSSIDYYSFISKIDPI